MYPKCQSLKVIFFYIFYKLFLLNLMAKFGNELTMGSFPEGTQRHYINHKCKIHRHIQNRNVDPTSTSALNL